MSIESTTEISEYSNDLLNLLNNSHHSLPDSQWTRDYLERLTSLSLTEILKEPEQLREEEERTKQEAQTLAFKEYPSFIRAQNCKEEVEGILSSLDTQLKAFVGSTIDLEEACQIFEKEAVILKEEQGKISRVLEYQNDLTDLLEIPQLMETCVWNGYYSEAMDLASHVRLLLVRHPLPIVKTIQEQVQQSSDLMFIQLLSHLRRPIRLAAAINVVGFLRRMDVFHSEMELRMVFLRCRHDYLQQKLLRIKRDLSEDKHQRNQEAFDYLKQYIDVMREQMFETGTHYVSIFSNDQGPLLSDYMIHLIRSMKELMTLYLPAIDDTSALSSLLTQLQYCGMSLGRIGLDFRHVFINLFEEAIQPIILQWIHHATEELVQVLSNALQQNILPSSWMSSKTVYQHDMNEKRRNTFQPPMLLVTYPSLALFTNGLLSAFNALRLLPAMSVYEPIQNHLEECFLEIDTVLKQYADLPTSKTPDEITYIQSYMAAYNLCCVPYLKACLSDGIYGNYTANTLNEDKNTVDISNDAVDTSNNTVDTTNDTVDTSNNTVDISNDKLDTTNNTVDTTNDKLDTSNNTVDVEVKSNNKVKKDSTEVDNDDNTEEDITIEDTIDDKKKLLKNTVKKVIGKDVDDSVEDAIEYTEDNIIKEQVEKRVIDDAVDDAVQSVVDTS